MILLADSGSTKCAWIFVRPADDPISVRTKGINPYYQTTAEIENLITADLVNHIPVKEVKEIYFYGAGCHPESKCAIVRAALKSVFSSASHIEVESDLLAAARALFGKQEGIACISGTGSNTGHYNGSVITDNVRSLGLYMGDEGSGGHLGKLLMSEYMRDALPEDLKSAIEAYTPDRIGEMMDKIYRQPFPNRYLASFAPLYSTHQQHPIIQKLAKESFTKLFDLYIIRYPQHRALPVSFIGSVALSLKEIIYSLA